MGYRKPNRNNDSSTQPERTQRLRRDLRRDTNLKFCLEARKTTLVYRIKTKIEGAGRGIRPIHKPNPALNITAKYKEKCHFWGK